MTDKNRKEDLIMVQRYVYGSYETVQEAERAAEHIRESGIPVESIIIVGNDEAIRSLESGSFHVVSPDNREAAEDKGFWESMREAFTAGESPDRDTVRENDTNFEDVDLDLRTHRSSLREGHILVLVDVEYRDQLRERRESDAARVSDAETVRLHEERLHADTYEDTEEVRFKKRVVEDEETQEIPVRREKLNVEHRDVPDEKVTNSDTAFQEEEIDVHVSEEKPVVERETYVTDEVDINKEVETDVEEVKGKTRKEILEQVDADEEVENSEHRRNRDRRDNGNRS